MDQILRKRVENKIEKIVGKKKYMKHEQVNRKKVFGAYNTNDNTEDIIAALVKGFPEVTEEQMRDIVENTNFFHYHESGAIILDQRVFINSFLDQIRDRETKEGEYGTICISNARDMHSFDYTDKKFLSEYVYDYYKGASVKSATVRKIKDRVEWSITIGGGGNGKDLVDYKEDRKRKRNRSVA